MTADRWPEPSHIENAQDHPEHEDLEAEDGGDYVEYYANGVVSPESSPDPIDEHRASTEGYYTDSYSLPEFESRPGPTVGSPDPPARPEGPVCRECGEPTTVKEWEWDFQSRDIIDWAECEACRLGWGPYQYYTNFQPQRASVAPVGAEIQQLLTGDKWIAKPVVYS